MANESQRGVAPAACSSPELTAEQFEEMLAELDALCRQARELSTEIQLQMVQQKQQDARIAGVIRFPRPASR
jgi:hypothetical protein